MLKTGVSWGELSYPSESATFDPLTSDVQKDEMLSKNLDSFKIQLLFIQMGNQILKEEMLLNSNTFQNNRQKNPHHRGNMYFTDKTYRSDTSS